MTIFRTNKTRFFIRWWWNWYIFWIPTIESEYHPKDDSVLCNFSVGSEEKDYKGSELGFQIHLFIWTIDMTFWWNIEEKIYKK